jgi:hypothetical protein
MGLLIEGLQSLIGEDLRDGTVMRRACGSQLSILRRGIKIPMTWLLGHNQESSLTLGTTKQL